MVVSELVEAGLQPASLAGSGANHLTLLRHAIAVEQDHHCQTGEPAHADMTAFLLVRGADSHYSGPPYGATPLAEAKARGHWLAAELIRAWNTRGSAAAT